MQRKRCSTETDRSETEELESLDEVCNACLLNSLTRWVTFTFAMRREKGCSRRRQKLGRSVTSGFFPKNVWSQGGEHYQNGWSEWTHRSTTLILHWPSAGQTGACPLYPSSFVCLQMGQQQPLALCDLAWPSIAIPVPHWESHCCCFSGLCSYWSKLFNFKNRVSLGWSGLVLLGWWVKLHEVLPRVSFQGVSPA